MSDFLWVGFGGLIGANARFLLVKLTSSSLPNWFKGSFLHPTLIVNIVGSFILAAFLSLASQRIQIPESVRLFLAIGFCGSFTTFSTFTLELINLHSERGWWITLLSAILHNGVCIAVAFLGWRLAEAR